MGPIPGHITLSRGSNALGESDFSSAQGLPAVATALVFKGGFLFQYPCLPIHQP